MDIIHPELRKFKCMYYLDEQSDINSVLEKVPVNAGNLEKVMDSRSSWYPNIDVQIERLSQEWSQPESDGTGFLTYNRLSEIMTKTMINDIREEIDRKIFEDIMGDSYES